MLVQLRASGQSGHGELYFIHAVVLFLDVHAPSSITNLHAVGSMGSWW